MLLFIYSIFKIKEKLFLFLVSSFLLVALEPMNFLLFLSLLLMVLGVPLTQACLGVSVVLPSLVFLMLRRSGLLGRAV
jgi:hypothetical protein